MKKKQTSPPSVSASVAHRQAFCKKEKDTKWTREEFWYKYSFYFGKLESSCQGISNPLTNTANQPVIYNRNNRSMFIKQKKRYPLWAELKIPLGRRPRTWALSPKKPPGRFLLLWISKTVNCVFPLEPPQVSGTSRRWVIRPWANPGPGLHQEPPRREVYLVPLPSLDLARGKRRKSVKGLEPKLLVQRNQHLYFKFY